MSCQCSKLSRLAARILVVNPFLSEGPRNMCVFPYCRTTLPARGINQTQRHHGPGQRLPPLAHPGETLDQHRRGLIGSLARLFFVPKASQFLQLLLCKEAPEIALDHDRGKLPFCLERERRTARFGYGESQHRQSRVR